MKRQHYDILQGQIWRDRDPRSYSGSRRVRITESEGPGGRVWYRQVVGLGSEEVGRVFVSRYERFQRTFELMGVVQSCTQ